MKKFIALAVVMAAFGAAGALIALRLLSRPRVAPAPFGPEVPLPTTADLEGEEEAPSEEPRMFESEPSWSANALAVADDALEPTPASDAASGMLMESEVPLPIDVVAEGREANPPAPLDPVVEPTGGLADERASASAPMDDTEAQRTPPPFEPDVTDEVPSHHVPPAVSDVVGEPVAINAETEDVEPSHVAPAPVSEVTGEHTEAVLEAQEALAGPVTEAIDQVAARAEDSSGNVDGDFLTNYFNQLAETPTEETAEREPTVDATALEMLQDDADEPLPSSVEEALATLPGQDIAPLGRRDAESYLDEGNVYFNVGQYGLAIERYGNAIDLAPDLTAAYYNRANARTRAGEYDGALSDYDRALLLQPHDADALNNRGMLHLYRASYGDALNDFNAALSIDPADTTVMVNRGLAHLHGGDAAAALVDFQSASSLDTTDAAAHYGAAQAAAALENRDESLRHLSRALEIDPGYAREAAADPKLQLLQGDDTFMRLLRASGSRAER